MSYSIWSMRCGFSVPRVEASKGFLALLIPALLIPVFLVSGISTAAPTPPLSPEARVSGSDTPDGLGADELAGLQAQIRAYEAAHGHDLRALPNQSSFIADNPEQQLRARFELDGAQLSMRRTSTAAPEDGGALGLRLVGAGYAGHVASVATAERTAIGNRIEYRRGPLTEWYENDARGIEHGFTFAEPPSNTPANANRKVLVVELALSDGWSARLDADELGAELRDASGVARFGYRGLHAFDATGRALPARMQLAGTVLTLSADSREAVYPVTIDPLITTLEAKLVASVPDWWQASGFGRGIAISGDTIVAGAYGDDHAGNGSGSAYVFERIGVDGSRAVLRAKLTASDAVLGHDFGREVSISGDTIVVGAWPDNGGAGAAYVFVKPGGGWSGALNEDAKLTASDAGPLEQLGYSVSISGDTIVAGAPTAARKGSAYVFVKPGGGWSGALNEDAKLTSSDAKRLDYFGDGVSISGDTILVGARGDDDAGATSGSAYVFVKPGGGWSGALNEDAKLTASDAAASDAFAWSLSFSGDTAAIGSLNDDDGRPVYVFVEPGGGWSGSLTEDAKLTGSDVPLGESFGHYLSISGDTVVAGASNDDHAGSQSGSAYVFVKPGGGWSGDLNEDAKIIASDAQANHGFGKGVSIFGDTILVGAGGDDSGGIDNTGAVYLFVKPAGGWSAAGTENSKFTPALPDAAPDDAFGWSVSISGSTAVVGSRGDDDGGSESGSVYVFERPVAGHWSIAAKLTASAPDADDLFGNSVSISGATVVVGSYGDDDGGFSSGSAYVYVEPVGGWTGTLTEDAKLTASDAGGFDWFGFAVSISGDTILVGSKFDNDGGADSGSAYVFVEPFAGWSGSLSENAKLVASDDAPNDLFGNSVSISGDTAVVGSYSDDDGAADTGSAYVFVRPGTGWSGTLTEDAKLTASDAQADDWFGFAVSASGDTILVGAKFDDDGGSKSGSAYVFVEPGGGWSGSLNEDAKLTASDPAVDDFFGDTVSISGQAIAIGSPRDDDGGADSGSVYVFIEPESGWSGTLSEDAKIAAPDAASGDEFGISVSISAGTVVAGAWLDDDLGADAGSAYVHLVFSACDNGIVEGSEECDGGACCSDSCEYESAASVCRASAGFCDIAEACTGSSAFCPADALEPGTTQCRASAGACDATDFCDGVSAACPDVKWGGACRAAAGECDSVELCDGVTNDCPADTKLTGECRAGPAACDIAEFCDGVTDDCPINAVQPAGVECRPAEGVCDVAEGCNGSSTSCPADQVLDAVPCPDGDVCNGDDMCEAGACVVLVPLDCDDADPCTADSCDAITGCGHAPLEFCAGAGLPATSNLGATLLVALLGAAGVLRVVVHRRRSGA